MSHFLPVTTGLRDRQTDRQAGRQTEAETQRLR